MSPFSEFRNRKDTSNVLIPSVVLVSKFARRSISECGELRYHDTSQKSGLSAWGIGGASPPNNEIGFSAQLASSIGPASDADDIGLIGAVFSAFPGSTRR